MCWQRAGCEIKAMNWFQGQHARLVDRPRGPKLAYRAAWAGSQGGFRAAVAPSRPQKALTFCVPHHCLRQHATGKR
jgi:hypothetical protein